MTKMSEIILFKLLITVINDWQKLISQNSHVEITTVVIKNIMKI